MTEEMISPLIISIKTATVASAVTFFLGTALAYFVLHLKRFRAFFDAIITLPIVLPPTVIGFFLLLIFGRNGFFGKFLSSFDIRLVFSWQAAVISAVIVSVPLMYRSVLAAFEGISHELPDAARTLGVSEFRIFTGILLPNSIHGLSAGFVLSFTRALGEFGATIMFAGNIPGKTQTMSTAIYAAVQANDYDLALFWTVMIIAFSLLFVILLNALKSCQTKRGMLWN